MEPSNFVVKYLSSLIWAVKLLIFASKELVGLEVDSPSISTVLLSVVEFGPCELEGAPL